MNVTIYRYQIVITLEYKKFLSNVPRHCSLSLFEFIRGIVERDAIAKLSCLFLQDVAGGGVGGGGGKGVGATWPDTVKQSGAGGTLTPADRHGSVQVSLPAHLSSIFHCLYLFLSCHFVFYFAKSFSFFSTLLHLFISCIRSIHL